jgi:two-component system chemotaxis response regulator CheB
VRKIRVLVADDSPLVRDLIRTMIESDEQLEVAGEAANGLEAIEQVRALKPDIVTMDIEMPVLDGLQAIERIMCENAVPILVVTTRSDAKTAFVAISKGALDLVVKPEVSAATAREFNDRLRLLSKVKVLTHLSGRCLGRRATDPVPLPGAVPAGVVVAVAASTGGPDALSIILSRLPEGFPVPIVIAQHISDGFAGGMVGWLRTLSRVRVTVAADGEALEPGVAYVCPSESHMRVTPALRLALVARRPADVFRPSCDLLLSSVATVCGARAVGVILTGMGNDGVAGICAIKAAGGATLAQDEKTSVIFGMPNLAIESGCIDRVLPLEEIAAQIVRAVSGRGAAAARRGA